MGTSVSPSMKFVISVSSFIICNIPMGLARIDTHGPVCGEDGVTYPNSMIPHIYGVNIECRGKCPCSGNSVGQEDVCAQKPEVRGHCRKMNQGWTFDNKIGRCKEYYFGGCSGYGNYFNSLAECQKTCGGTDVWDYENQCRGKADGDNCKLICKAVSCAWGQAKCCNGQCIQGTKEDRTCPRSDDFCYDHCGDPHPPGSSYSHECNSCDCTTRQVWGKVISVCTRNKCNSQHYPCPQMPREGPCNETPGVAGNCRAAFPAWSFHKETGECKEFIYGGCGGNGNTFSSQRQCQVKCIIG